MTHADRQQKMRQAVPRQLSESTALFKEVLNAPLNEDAIFRAYMAGGTGICAVYIEGMADEKLIGEFVLRAVSGLDDSQSEDISALENRLLEIAQVSHAATVAQAVESVVSGMTCLLIDGSAEALLLETRAYPHRGVEQPTNEDVVIGPHEAFNEHFRTNISLVRRYVQSPDLITEKIKLGTSIPTQAAILYLTGTASDACVQEVRRRLRLVNAPVVNGSGALEQLIEDHPYSLLPQMLQTERPDRAASCITDGQIAIIVENSPYALIAPVTLFHLVHASDDSFLRWQYGSAIRLVRMLGVLVSLLLPAVYVALTLYHTHLIPMALLTSIAESRANVPFPVVVEVLFMEFSFYLLNEAGLRTPAQIGSAFGIVGALVLGQAAVSASIISPILIIIIALTGLGNYVIPNYGFGVGLIIYRLLLIVLSALMGVYGLTIGLFAIVLHLCALKSFGVDFMAPVAPWRRHNPDILLRLPLRFQKMALFFSSPHNWVRRKEHDT